MKATSLLALLLSPLWLLADPPDSAPSLPEVPAGELRSYYDFEADRDMRSLSFSALSYLKTTYSGLRLSITAPQSGPKEIKLYLNHESPHYTKGCEGEMASLRADGKTLVASGAFKYYSGERLTDMGGFLYHDASVTLSTKDLAALVKAKKVEGRLCGLKFLLTKDQRAALSIFERLLTP